MRNLALLALLLILTPPLAAQDWQQDLAKLGETPAVTGYEQELVEQIRARLKGLAWKQDNIGNLRVTLGTGAPHRLIVTSVDEPGYVVSRITPEGYLRVQRLPQQAPHALFDPLHAAQPVILKTRRGRRVHGVVAGLSTHLQPGRRDAPRVTHPDEIYIDIGAASAEEARRAGVDLLDPIALDRAVHTMGFGKVAGMAIGDRFGSVALVELLRRIEPSRLQGTLTVAFATQQWAGSRGLDRLMQQVRPDEVIYVGRLIAQRAGTTGAAPSAPRREPGSGLLIGASDPGASPAKLPAELLRLADEHGIPLAADFSAPVPRASYTQGPALPDRFAHLAIATAWPSTPAEVLDTADLGHLVRLLESYVHGAAKDLQPGAVASGAPLVRKAAWGPQGPPVTHILERLVETYGVSGHESAVRDTIASLLPPWAKPETDAAGNLILRLGASIRGRKTPHLLFVAHTDEIGYVVRSIADDSRLVVQSRGGAILEYFAGHPVLVHTLTGTRPGVIELPEGWNQTNFEWPRGPQGALRVDVGARTPAEVEQLGVRAGDWITVPKKYRRLQGTRISGRSLDDRVGCTALVAAAWALGPRVTGREIVFVWSTEEEVGLRGALALADRLAAQGGSPDYVFAVDTFVSSDSPLESKRFAQAELGRGFVVRAVDNSNITRRTIVDRVVALARAHQIPVQVGVTGGGNDGAAFLRHGAIDVPVGWPLRYSHSPGEVIDTRDVRALSRIVAAIARAW